MRRPIAAFASLFVFVIAAGAQPWFSDVFPPEEYAARRARVIAQIGDGIAVLQGAAERPAEAPFRQNNQFFYLTGVEVPRALLILDGRAKTSTLYLADNSRRARAWGALLEAGDEAVRITGVDAALKREEAEAAIAEASSSKRAIYTTFRPEVLGSGSAGDAAAWQSRDRLGSLGRPSVARTGIHREAEAESAGIGDPRSRSAA